MTKNVSHETKSLKKRTSIQLFLDVSSSNTGVVMYDKSSKTVVFDDINLKSIKRPEAMKYEDFEKTKSICIKNYLDKLSQAYDVETVYMEGIYISRDRLKSSQILLKLHGFLMYHFLDTPQYYIPPATIKKNITSNGRAKKIEVRRVLEEKYGAFPNDDISDAFAILVCIHGYQDYKIKEDFK